MKFFDNQTNDYKDAFSIKAYKDKYIVNFTEDGKSYFFNKDRIKILSEETVEVIDVPFDKSKVYVIGSAIIFVITFIAVLIRGLIFPFTDTIAPAHEKAFALIAVVMMSSVAMVLFYCGLISGAKWCWKTIIAIYRIVFVTAREIVSSLLISLIFVMVANLLLIAGVIIFWVFAFLFFVITIGFAGICIGLYKLCISVRKMFLDYQGKEQIIKKHTKIIFALVQGSLAVGVFTFLFFYSPNIFFSSTNLFSHIINTICAMGSIPFGVIFIIFSQ